MRIRASKSAGERERGAAAAVSDAIAESRRRARPSAPTEQEHGGDTAALEAAVLTDTPARARRESKEGFRQSPCEV